MINKNWLIGLALLLSFGLGWGFSNWDGTMPERPNSEQPAEVQWLNFHSPLLGLSFDYPKTHMLAERELQGGGYEIQIAEDTPENRAVFSGQAPGREGPISVTVQVFPNPENLLPLEWAEKNNISNISLARGQIQEFQVSGAPAILYQWDGLYRADQIIFSANGKIFSLAGTYLNEEDEIRIIFANLIASLRILESAEPVGKLPADYNLAYRFASYPAEEIFTGRPAAPNFSGISLSAEIKNKISEQAAQGPNFAGKLTVVSWTCGAGCENHAILDAQSGKIIELGLQSSYGVAYRLDSALFIVNPPSKWLLEEIAPTEPITDYYAWNSASQKFSFLSKRDAMNQEPLCAQVIAEAKNPLTGEVREFRTPCSIPFGWQTAR